MHFVVLKTHWNYNPEVIAVFYTKRDALEFIKGIDYNRYNCHSSDIIIESWQEDESKRI